MPDENSDSNLIGALLRIAGWAGAALGFITTAVGFANLCLREARMVFYVLLLIGALACWGSAFYIYFLKKKKRMQAGMRSALPVKQPAFPALARRVSLIAIFAIPSFAIVGAAVQVYRSYQKPTKIIVTVANFKSLDASTPSPTERILADLRKATAPYASDIEIDPLKAMITEQDGGSKAATTIGLDRKSAVVIWGWNDREVIHANFEVLQTGSYVSELKGNQTLDMVVSGHENFKVQMMLSQNLIYLTLLTVGLARYEAEDFQGTARFLNDAISHAPDLANAEAAKDTLAISHLYLGRALADQGKYTDAIAKFREALNLRPDYPAAHLHLGYAYTVTGESLASQELTRAVELNTNLLRQNPDDVDAYINRGSAYSHLGKFDNALLDYNKAIDLGRPSAGLFNNRGIVFYKQENFEKALQDFNSAINLQPTDASSYNNRGTTYSALGEFDLALNDYAYVIRSRPKNPLSYLNRAFVHYDKRDYASAIKDYDSAIQLDSKNFRAYRNRAWANMFSGRYEEAARDAQIFLDLQRPCKDNDNYKYVAILAYLALKRNSRSAEADALLQRSVAECGSSGWLITLMRFLKKDLSETQLLAEAGNDKDQLTEAHAYIAMEQLFSGQSSQAIEHFAWVRDHGNRAWDEYHLALTELNRLGAMASASR